MPGLPGTGQILAYVKSASVFDRRTQRLGTVLKARHDTQRPFGPPLAG